MSTVLQWLVVVIGFPTVYIWIYVEPAHYPMAAWVAFWYMVVLHLAWWIWE
jgi:hypothetical protein